MVKLWEKTFVGLTLSLLLGLLVWTVAFADRPTNPSGTSYPAKGKNYSYTENGVGPTTVVSSSRSEIYWEMAESTFSLHNTRVQQNGCWLCHTRYESGGLVYVDGMNLYGQDFVAALAAETGGTVEYGNDTVDVITHSVISKVLLGSLGDMDSDKDGVKNNAEMWALSFPGGVYSGTVVISDTRVSVPSPESMDFSMGIHGGYGVTPDGCARCHRAHTASAPKLLVMDQVALCMSCHTGQNAMTDVYDGVLSGFGGTGIVSGTVGLRGGGFENALMNTVATGPQDGVIGSGNSNTATSKHDIDGSLGTIWGNINASDTPGKAGVSIVCGNCHDPHGPTFEYRVDGKSKARSFDADPVAQYRMLRGAPEKSDYGYDLTVPTAELSVPHNYTQTYDSLGRPSTLYQTNDRVGDFCATCHVMYMVTSIPYDPADTHAGMVEETPRAGYTGPFLYQHATKESGCSTGSCHASTAAAGKTLGSPWEYAEAGGSSGNITRAFSRPRCLECHVAHGTSAEMGPWASGVNVPFPDETTAAGNARSSLLRLDNRGVCTGCHEK